MQVNNRNMVLDLSSVQGTLIDPTIARTVWVDHLRDGKKLRPGGMIHRDGQRVVYFYDQSAIAPYVAAFEAEWLKRSQDQAAYDLEAERLAEELAKPIIVAKPVEQAAIAYEGA